MANIFEYAGCVHKNMNSISRHIQTLQAVGRKVQWGNNNAQKINLLGLVGVRSIHHPTEYCARDNPYFTKS